MLSSGIRSSNGAKTAAKRSTNLFFYVALFGIAFLCGHLALGLQSTTSKLFALRRHHGNPEFFPPHASATPSSDLSTQARHGIAARDSAPPAKVTTAQQQDASAAHGEPRALGEHTEPGSTDAAVTRDPQPVAEAQPEQTANPAPNPARQRLNALQIPGALRSVPLKAAPVDIESPDFDWLAYLDYNADVTAYQFTSETLVKRHYKWMGESEKRMHQRVPLVLRYSACGGLMNQHYSHLAALVLASALGADVAMPVSLTRDSFEKYYSLNADLNQVKWRPLPQDAVYNVDRIEDYLHERGAKLWTVPTHASLPDFDKQEQAFPTWLPEGFDESQRIKYREGTSVYIKALPLAEIVRDIVGLVVTHTRELLTKYTLKRPPTMLVDLPCALFSVNLCSPTAEVLSEGVARHLPFADPLERLAEKIIQRIGSKYNGLHLRLEKDAKDWAMMSGGMEILEKMYWAACNNNGFNQGTPLYVATGLLTYNDTAKMESVRVEISKFAQAMLYKELYLSAEELAPLSADQLSVIDYLVLLRSERFVGIGSSTYSCAPRLPGCCEEK